MSETPETMRCTVCSEPRWEHNAMTTACPKGRWNFHATNRFTPAPPPPTGTP